MNDSQTEREDAPKTDERDLLLIALYRYFSQQRLAASWLADEHLHAEAFARHIENTLAEVSRQATPERFETEALPVLREAAESAGLDTDKLNVLLTPAGLLKLTDY